MEKVCIICGKPINDGDDLMDRFGCHTDIHAACYPAIAEKFTPQPDAAKELAERLLTAERNLNNGFQMTSEIGRVMQEAAAALRAIGEPR